MALKEKKMKAQNIKEHQHKQEYLKEYDKWGDEKYVIAGVEYKTKAEAKKAVHDLITNEFNARNRKEG